MTDKEKAWVLGLRLQQLGSFLLACGFLCLNIAIWTESDKLAASGFTMVIPGILVVLAGMMQRDLNQRPKGW